MTGNQDVVVVVVVVVVEKDAQVVDREAYDCLKPMN